MSATLKRLEATRVELEVTIPPHDLEAARERAFRELVKAAKIPGFRQGRIPRKLYEQRYGTMAIEERALDEVFPKVYMGAIEEHDLYPLDRPDVDWLPYDKDSNTLRFKATVVVRPTIQLADYATMKLEVVPPTASDDDVEEAITKLRRQLATAVPVERPAELGDVVVIDYAGSIDGEPFEGGTAKSSQVELQEANFIPGFASGIVGMIHGETRSIEAQFPVGYFEPRLSGKAAAFDITLHEVKTLELAELDDSFVERVLGAGKTVADLRREVRERLNATHRAQLKNEYAESYIQQLLELHDVAMPELLVQRELEAALKTRQFETSQRGLEWEAYLVAEGKSEESLKAELRTEAEHRVKTMLVIEEIAKAEGITATPAEIDQELSDLAMQYRQPKERVRELLGSQFHSFVDGVVRAKALDRLLDRALGVVGEA